jgi:hypothetical protein
MMTARDPTTMSADERLAEVAAILAIGYSRLLLSRRNGLDLGARAEAPVHESMAEATPFSERS